MKIRPIIILAALMFAPRTALAFMDAPTVTVTFPSYLIILVPLVVCEVVYLSRNFAEKKFKVLKVGISVHLLAVVFMVLESWLHTYVRHLVIEAMHFKTTGIFTIIRNPASALDVIFSLTIGSVVLIQDEAYRWLNVLVIMVFLLPTFALSTFLAARFFQTVLPETDKMTVKSTLTQIKSIEYGVLVIVSFLYLSFVYQL
ncbi:hypothetical protein KOM00_07350 [Geomonas sp. Red69]|uniref:hypothetical protein n=1 Tax=Geomonas diazotrophica TaxID=2843197 RepID=UPI001C0FD3AE|nr:hypothetical protein [Geomonas diazotrophica]MBU5636551.1 hypothetical protein [Geomonas diazotrophica]